MTRATGRRQAAVLLVVTVLATMLITRRVFGLPGPVERVDVSSAGIPANADSSSAPSFSTDGRYVAFASPATNLVPGDTNAKVDVFVRDRTAGTTERVTVASDGTQADGDSATGGTGPVISANGRFVAFDSLATNLVPGDTNGVRDIFVHDRLTGTTERVSVATDGTQATGRSLKPSISGDGRMVAFQSNDENLAPGAADNNADDVFVHDRQTGVTTLVSVGTPALGGASVDPAISADGRYVAFVGPCGLVAPCSGFQEQQIFERDLQAPTPTRLTFDNDSAGSKANPAISADGRYVAFEAASASLVPGDTNGVGDVFVVDRDTSAVERVSVASDGSQGNANSSSALEGPGISADGRLVVFESFASNLVPGDTNGVRDVFVHDRATGQTTRESVAADGSQANGPSTHSAISPDGSTVGYVSSASNLVPGDTGHTDVFAHDRVAEASTSSSSTPSTSTPSTGISSTSSSSTTTVLPSTTTTTSTTTVVPSTTTTLPPGVLALPPCGFFGPLQCFGNILGPFFGSPPPTAPPPTSTTTTLVGPPTTTMRPPAIPPLTGCGFFSPLQCFGANLGPLFGSPVTTAPTTTSTTAPPATTTTSTAPPATRPPPPGPLCGVPNAVGGVVDAIAPVAGLIPGLGFFATAVRAAVDIGLGVLGCRP